MTFLKKEHFLIYLIYFIFSLFFLFKNIFIDYSPISHDEVVNITTYLHKETLFLKNYPNNHILTSVIGFFLSKILGTQIIFFRLISYTAFVIIFFLSIKKFNNIFFSFIFLLLFVLSDNLYLYSFLFRGYYLSSLLFVIIFLLLISNTKHKEKFIYGISIILIVHNVSTAYLVLPIALWVFLNDFQNIKFNSIRKIFLYFFLPFLIFHFFLGILNAIYISDFYFTIINQNILFYKKINLFFLQVFPEFIEGVKIIFFNPFTKLSLFNSSYIFYKILFEDVVISLIMISSFLISIFRIFFLKKNTILDNIIFTFFIFFILINKLPPIRIFVGFVYFFLFYVFLNLENNTLNFFRFKNYILFILLLILLFFSFNRKITNIKVNGNLDFWHLNLESTLQSKILNCRLPDDFLPEFHKHYIYYLYLRDCNITSNLNEFRTFYKFNRLNN
jgi:hypothetical protein